VLDELKAGRRTRRKRQTVSRLDVHERHLTCGRPVQAQPAVGMPSSGVAAMRTHSALLVSGYP